MMRKNIFEILAERQDVDEALIKIEELLSEPSVFNETLESVVEQECLQEWKARGRTTCCDDIRKRLGIEPKKIRYKQLFEEEALLYLEYVSNMIWLLEREFETSECDKEYKYLLENVYGLINDMGFEIKVFEEEEKVLLVEKNAAATAVAEICDSKTACEVIEYNHFLLKGNIDKKQKILKVLADKFESIRGEIRSVNKELESNTGYLLNKMNIRHNNVEGKGAIEYVKNLTNEEMEEWYDETYQMILLCLLEHDNIERNRKVLDLKRNIEG